MLVNRAHVLACSIIPEELRQRVRVKREATQNLLKQSRQLVDRADMLMREIEAARADLNATRQRCPSKDRIVKSFGPVSWPLDPVLQRFRRHSGCPLSLITREFPWSFQDTTVLP